MNKVFLSRRNYIANLDFFAKTTGLEIMPVLKANAYGHGLAEIASLTKTRYIVVNSLAEAEIAKQYFHGQILVLTLPNKIPRKLSKQFEFVVQNDDDIAKFRDVVESVNIHLAINTGMNRLGVRPKELEEFAKKVLLAPNLHVEGVFSHLFDADATSEEISRKQIELFDASVEKLRELHINPPLIHLAATAGSLLVAKSRYANAARVGLGVYGLNPLSRDHPQYRKFAKLKPVLSLTSRIIQINQLEPGDKVSYNGTFTAKKPMMVGVVAVGYYDGVPRELSNRGSLLVNGHNCPIVGKVCMNLTTIDISDLDVHIGDEACVISARTRDPNSLQRMSEDYNLFIYQLPLGVAAELPREIIA